MPPTNQQPTGCGSDAELRAESAAVAAILDGWRRKATDILLLVVAAAHLPVIVLGWLGHGPQMGPFPKAVGVVVYVAIAAAALFRGIDYRRRMWASILVVYPALLVASLVAPDGPYAQIGIVTLPIYALVLLGARAGVAAITASTAILVAVPFVRENPGVVHLLGFDPAQAAMPLGLVWFRVSVKAASLFALMVLLDRFHRLLLATLTQRIVAQRKMKDEMHQRQRLEREIASIGDAERYRLGQELHDGVCQQVTAALLRCQALERRLDRGGTVSGTDFGPLSSLLAETIDDAHNVARGLCPLEPHPGALAPALRALTQQTQQIAAIRCEFNTSGDVRMFDPEAAQHLYRIAQESVSNAVRHANASRIAVQLSANDGELTLQIEDDGTGLPATPPGGGMGLRTMAYRAQIINGELTVAAGDGGGTRVSCRVPLPAAVLATGQQI